MERAREEEASAKDRKKKKKRRETQGLLSCRRDQDGRTQERKMRKEREPNIERKMPLIHKSKKTLAAGRKRPRREVGEVDETGDGGLFT